MTASNDTSGFFLVAVSASAGGLSLAQTPQSSRFDGMPNSAIATGFVDDTGEAAVLARSVLRHVRRRNGCAALPQEDADTDAFSMEVTLGDVLHELRLRTGVPFDEYKKSTVTRRIERRMALKHAGSLAAYLQILRKEPEELETLRRETLIGVTSFFRDPEAFGALEQAMSDISDGERGTR